LGIDPAMRPLLAARDELIVHGLYAFKVLFKDRLDRASSLFEVTPYPAKQPYIRVRVDVDPEIEELAQLRISKEKESFNNNNRGGFYGLGLHETRVS